MHRSKLLVLTTLALTSSAAAFCGFFVAKGDSKLFNRSNQVIIARDGNRSVFTMMNDYQGDVKDFARIVPIPVVPKREDIRIGDPSVVKKLDAYSAPRLVEYFDEDPCMPRPVPAPTAAAPMEDGGGAGLQGRAGSLGVKIEASYQVGEYDVLILSATQQTGLGTFLRGEGYTLPAGADAMLGGYIKGGMKFFVVRVNVERFDKAGGGFLNPIVLSYTSEKFMLPIRLGTLNSPGEQDLTVYLLSKKGKVVTRNYRTAYMPTDKEVPMLVKNQFEPFYRHVFKQAYEREGRNIALMEYAWDSSNCDPCSTEPPSSAELKEAGVFWKQQDEGGSPVFLTRLHVRYTAKTFPEDLHFKETNDVRSFQARYVLRHDFKGKATCDAATAYQKTLPRRHEGQAQTLANLTGWDVNHIRRRMAGQQ